MSSSGLSTRETRTCRKESNKVTKKWRRGWINSPVRKVWDLEPFSLEKRRLRKTPEGRKKDGDRLFSVPSARTRDTSRNTMFPLNIRKHFFTVGWLSTGTGYPGRSWTLQPWRYSRAIWIQSWANGSKWPSLTWGIGPGDAQRSLPNSITLWFLWRWWWRVSHKTYAGPKKLEVAVENLSVPTQAPVSPSTQDRLTKQSISKFLCHSLGPTP